MSRAGSCCRARETVPNARIEIKEAATAGSRQAIVRRCQGRDRWEGRALFRSRQQAVRHFDRRDRSMPAEATTTLRSPNPGSPATVDIAGLINMRTAVGAVKITEAR